MISDLFIKEEITSLKNMFKVGYTKDIMKGCLTMMNLRQFVSKVRREFMVEENVNKKSLNKYVTRLPRPLRAVDFSQHFRCTDRFIYGIQDLAYDSLSQEEINAACEAFKSIFMEVLNLKAELKIEEVVYNELRYEDDEGRVHDESSSIYLISWIVFL